MQEGAGGLFVGSLVYGLGLSIGLALAGAFLFWAGLRIYGWYTDHQEAKQEKIQFDKTMREMVLNRSREEKEPKE